MCHTVRHQCHAVPSCGILCTSGYCAISCHTAPYCAILCCIVLYPRILCHIVEYCATSYYNMPYQNISHTLFCFVRHCARYSVLCHTMLHHATLCHIWHTVPYGAILCHFMPYFLPYCAIACHIVPSPPLPPDLTLDPCVAAA